MIRVPSSLHKKNRHLINATLDLYNYYLQKLATCGFSPQLLFPALLGFLFKFSFFPKRLAFDEAPKNLKIASRIKTAWHEAECYLKESEWEVKEVSLPQLRSEMETS